MKNIHKINCAQIFEEKIITKNKAITTKLIFIFNNNNNMKKMWKA